MVRIRRLTFAALLFAAGLVPVSTASAGPVMDWLFPDDGPTPSYSPLRYWAPAVGHVHDNLQGPKISVYPPDRHPEIQPNYTILKYPCPAAPPAATIIEPPTPPAESRFRY